jgi:hypothetical protein
VLQPALVAIPEEPMSSICWLSCSSFDEVFAPLIKKTAIILEFLLLASLGLPLPRWLLFRLDLKP